MQQAIKPDSELEAAYRRTHFEVTLPGGELLTLRVDEANPTLRDIHERCGVSCSAFLTGWNPRSVPQPAALNEAANQELQQQLSALGLECWPGRGHDPSGDWPVEVSVFVPGLELAAACRHGRHFGQNAIVHAGQDAVPRLVWLQSPRPASPRPASPRPASS
jgi:Protein of unknown function (DUF3293)